MAPELRKRKPSTEVQKPNGTPKVAKVAAAKGKRKAPEEASPVSLKKQKSVKKAVAVEKPAKKPAQKSKKSKPVEEKVEEEVAEDETTIDVPDVSDSEDEGKEVQALVTELDSGDEDVTEGDDVYQPGQDVGKIPKVSKEVKQAAKGSDEEPGVIYIGRIPHGFYEHEMRQYFEQFGSINKLRLSRNKKTGASKHFAFVEFAEASTAEIVSKTMDNYLLFGHILKCRIIPKDQVHDDLFKGANRRFKAVPWNKMAGQRLNKPLTESAWANKVSKEQGKRAKKAAKLKELGYDFDMPDFKAVPAPAPAAAAAVENGESEVKAIEAAPVDKEEAKVEEEAEPEAEEEPTPAKKTKASPKTTPKAKAAKGKAAKGKGRKAKA